MLRMNSLLVNIFIDLFEISYYLLNILYFIYFWLVSWAWWGRPFGPVDPTGPTDQATPTQTQVAPEPLLEHEPDTPMAPPRPSPCPGHFRRPRTLPLVAEDAPRSPPSSGPLRFTFPCFHWPPLTSFCGKSSGPPAPPLASVGSGGPRRLPRPLGAPRRPTGAARRGGALHHRAARLWSPSRPLSNSAANTWSPE